MNLEAEETTGKLTPGAGGPRATGRDRADAPENSMLGVRVTPRPSTVDGLAVNAEVEAKHGG